MSAAHTSNAEDSQSLVPKKCALLISWMPNDLVADPSSLTAFRPVEEIYSAALELTREIGGMGAQRFADAVMTFSDIVATENNENKNAVAQLRNTVESQQRRISEMEQEMARNALEIQTLVRWCKSLVGDVKLLKDIALGVRICALIFALDSQLFTVSSGENSVSNQKRAKRRPLRGI